MVDDNWEAPGGSMAIDASEFKARCLQLIDEVAETGIEIVIIKNGRPVSRLVPHVERPKTIIGIDKGKIEILGDIIEPIDTAWGADTDVGRNPIDAHVGSLRLS